MRINASDKELPVPLDYDVDVTIMLVFFYFVQTNRNHHDVTSALMEPEIKEKYKKLEIKRNETFST